MYVVCTFKLAQVRAVVQFAFMEKGMLLTRLNNSASSVGGAHLLLTFTGHKAIGGWSGLFG